MHHDSGIFSLPMEMISIGKIISLEMPSRKGGTPITQQMCMLRDIRGKLTPSNHLWLSRVIPKRTARQLKGRDGPPEAPLPRSGFSLFK